MHGEDTLLTDDPGAFAVGSWTPERREAHQEVLLLVQALPPPSSRLTSADDKKARELAMTGVAQFQKDLPSFTEGDGIAARHEPSVRAVQWFMKLCPAFRLELCRRATTKKGRRCYCVSCEWTQLGERTGGRPATKSKTPLQCVWHVAVPEGSHLADLKSAIAKSGKSVSQKYGNAVNRVTESGRFHVGQVRSSDNGRRPSTKWCSVGCAGELRSSGGYYDVTIRPMRRKRQTKAKDESEVPDHNHDDKSKATERQRNVTLETDNGKSKTTANTIRRETHSTLYNSSAQSRRNLQHKLALTENTRPCAAGVVVLFVSVQHAQQAHGF